MNKILQRFTDVWKLDFLARFVAGEHSDNKTTVGFWCLFNVFIALFFACSFGVSLYGFEDDLVQVINENVPDGAKIAINDGQLSTENIDEPFFREINAENEYNDKYAGEYVVIIDTHSQTYDITSLDEYSGGVVILNDRAFAKDGDEVQQIVFADAPNFALAKEQILAFINENFLFPISVGLTVLVFAALVIGYGIFRLIAALWWALMLFILSKIFGVQVSYGVAYKAVLNFYFIPTAVVFLVSFAIIDIPLLVTTIFIIIFITNLWWMKKNMITEEVSPVTRDKKQKTVVKTVNKS